MTRSTTCARRETAPDRRSAIARRGLSRLPGRRLDLGRSLVGITLVCAQLAACGGGGRDENEKTGGSPADRGVTQEATSPDALQGVVTRLIQSLGSDDDDKRQQAIDSLVAMGPPVIDLVADALRDPSVDRRSGAVEVLGEIGGTAAVAPLLLALRDESEDVRLAAVEALGKIRDPRAVQPLLELYGREQNKQVRYECLTSLGAIGDPAAAPLLGQEVRSDDPYARMWAIDALCVMNDPRAAELAQALLEDSDPGVRRRVLRSCGRALDNPAGHKALLAIALGAEEIDIAIFARLDLVKYLQGPGGKQLAEEIRTAALKALSAGEGEALRAAFLLGELHDGRATARLVTALDDPNPAVRDHATLLLGRIGDPQAVPALIKILNDPVPMVRATAHQSLTWFAADGDTRAKEALQAYTGPTLGGRPVPR